MSKLAMFIPCYVAYVNGAVFLVFEDEETADLCQAEWKFPYIKQTSYGTFMNAFQITESQSQKG